MGEPAAEGSEVPGQSLLYEPLPYKNNYTENRSQEGVSVRSYFVCLCCADSAVTLVTRAFPNDTIA